MRSREKSIRSRLSCEMFRGRDVTVDSCVEQIGDTSRDQYLFTMLAGRYDGCAQARFASCMKVTYGPFVRFNVTLLKQLKQDRVFGGSELQNLFLGQPNAAACEE